MGRVPPRFGGGLITLVVAPQDFASGREILVEGETYRHLFRARRAEVGESIRLVDGEGNARAAKIARIDRKAGWIAPVEPVEIMPANEPAVRLTLLVPTLRPERSAWLIEKATELGAAAVRFLQMERAPREFGSGALERLRRIAVSALEQSHGARLPMIDGPHRWDRLESLGTGCDTRWLLDPGGAPGAFAVDAGGKAALLVGPEGGFSDGELREAHALGFEPRALGSRILRIETAAVAGAALALLEPRLG